MTDRRWCGGAHYVGYAKNIDERVRLHQVGYGALYTRTAVTFHLVRVWLDAGKDLELRIKRLGGGVAYCPRCRSTTLY